MSILKTTSRISMWCERVHASVNGGHFNKIHYQVYGDRYDTLYEAISSAIGLTLPINRDVEYSFTYEDSLGIELQTTLYDDFQGIIIKAYELTRFKCDNLNEEEQEFIDAIFAMKIEDKLTLCL